MRLIDAEALIDEIEKSAKSMMFNSHHERWTHEDKVEYAIDAIDSAPTINAVTAVRCKDCVYFKERHVRTPDGQEKSYAEMPTEAFGGLDDMFVTVEYGINVGSQCLVDCGKGYGEDKTVFREPCDFCSRGVRKEETAEERGEQA